MSLLRKTLKWTIHWRECKSEFLSFFSSSNIPHTFYPLDIAFQEFKVLDLNIVTSACTGNKWWWIIKCCIYQWYSIILNQLWLVIAPCLGNKTYDESLTFSDTNMNDTQVNELFAKFLSHENDIFCRQCWLPPFMWRKSLVLSSSSRGTKAFSRSDLGGHNARCENMEKM